MTEPDLRPSPSGPIASSVVKSVFGRFGPHITAVFGDYLASLIENDSSVAGASVKDALNNIAGSFLASLVGNDSAFQGLTVKDALDTLKEFNVQTGEPNIFEQDVSTVEVNSAELRFTINPLPGQTFSVWQKGVKTTYAVGKSAFWTDSIGLWYALFDSAGDLFCTQDGTLVEDAVRNGNGAFISTFYWNKTNGEALLLTDERHTVMPGTVHWHFHHYFGGQWSSGGDLTDITADATASDAATQFGITAALYADEDKDFISPAQATPANVVGYYQVWNAAEGVNEFFEAAATDFPFLLNGSSLPVYNEIDAITGQASLIDVPSGSFFNTHTVFVNAYDGTRRVIYFPGNTIYANRNAARAGARTELESYILGALGVLDAEIVRGHTVIREYRSSFAGTTKTRIVSAEDDDGNLTDFIDWRGNARTSANAGGGTSLVGNPEGANTDVGGSGASLKLAPNKSFATGTIADAASGVYTVEDLKLNEDYFDLAVTCLVRMTTTDAFRKIAQVVDVSVVDVAGTLTLTIEGAAAGVSGGDPTGLTLTLAQEAGVGNEGNLEITLANATGESIEGYIDVGWIERALP